VSKQFIIKLRVKS